LLLLHYHNFFCDSTNFSSSRCRLLILPPSSSSVDTINELLDDTKKHSQMKRVEGGCGSTCIQTGNVWPFVGLGRRVKETNQAGCTREINYFIMPRAIVLQHASL
jgi:hypothetical protein